MPELSTILPPPWRYFAIRKEGDREHKRWGWCWRERDVEFLRRDLDQYNLFIQLNESQGNEPRPTKESITGWRGFFIDIDPIDTSPAVWYARSEVVHAVQEMLTMRPSMTTVMTGRGIQLWVPFPEVIRPVPHWAESALRDFFEYLNNRAGNGKHGCRIDLSVADMTRLARMPWSRNQRTGAVGHIETVGDAQQNGSVPELLHTRWYTPRRKPQAPPPSPHAPKSWGSVVHRLSADAADFLSDGTVRGDRHRALCSTAYSLREQGCSENQVWKALLWGNNLCDDPLDQGELRRVLKSTRRRVPAHASSTHEG